MNARTPRRKETRPRHGLGREVEDEELFSHLHLLPYQRSRKRPTQSPHGEISGTTPKRPRSRSAASALHRTTSDTKSKTLSPEKHFASEDKSTTVIEQSLDEMRKGVPYPPRRFEDIAAMFASTRDMDLLQGAPRLSALAVNVARMYTAGGNAMDLSRLPDEFVYDILCHNTVSPELLKGLEELNPTRVNVLEAVWARLCLSKYEEDELPEGVQWWRALYQLRVDQEHGRLERATKRLRLGYNKAMEDREKRHMGKTKIIRTEGKKRRASSASTSGSLSLLTRMRMEFRREQGRR
ncbi:hypothetical protein BWQ96_02970 [Gracilariopsis chorda]|uniref:Elongin-A n=1 Tax=Gracilariopsis chorda TaxID=448386 RepID=A0A2V3IYQ0_9FLOR|nr:hypothetical protein BWQ96_02970 [Gracilariopsis chorda]|eukprot:PXF47195.1 hypothetical protein BWQ96_02970 [Gracilariopsis chorda]